MRRVFALIALMCVVLCACVKTDTSIQVDLDGTITLNATYRIDKSRIRTEEAMEQVVSLIKEQIESQNLAYEIYDDDVYKNIKINVPISNIDALCAGEITSSMALVPALGGDGAVEITQSGSTMTLKGPVNAQTLRTEQYSSQIGFDENYEARFTVSLPYEALHSNTEAVQNGDRYDYIWVATTQQGADIDISFELDFKEAQEATDGIETDSPQDMSKTVILIIACMAVLAIAVAIVFFKRNSSNK
ncbi:MAG: hypothetical protein Q4C12_03115 [Clostridia bacterium]|nr:hypothetical protein [Clostridia bacterium]